jgi:Zn-finger nucleic acid-binding protein
MLSVRERRYTGVSTSRTIDRSGRSAAAIGAPYSISVRQPIRRLMTCPNCGAPVRLDHERGLLICDYCGSQCTPPVDEDGVQVTGETAFPCAVCHTPPLCTARIEARDVLYCTACHSILVSMDDFGLLLEDLREHRTRVAALLKPCAGADSGRDLRCPTCSGAMDHHAYGGGDLGNAMIDSCEACCQVWLLRGVLGKILVPPAASAYSNDTYPGNLTATTARSPGQV